MFGTCDTRASLRLTSQTADSGVIFSDGIEADHLDFAAGVTVLIEPAARSGRLVV